MEARAGYKKTKLGWIPDSWEAVKLPDAAWFQEGPGLRKWQFTEDGIKVINITNMVDGYLDLSKTRRHISWDEFKKQYSHFECDPGDIVIASSGNSYCKHAIIRKTDLPLVMNTSVIRFKPLNGTDYQYLNQFLKSILLKKQIDFLITGGAQPNFGPAHLKQVWVPYPSLPEQQKIAEILTTVDDKITSIESRIQQTEQLKKGLMEKLLTEGVGHTEFKDTKVGRIPVSWEVAQTQDLLEDKKSLTYGILQPGDDCVDGIPMLRTVDISSTGTLNQTRILRVSKTIEKDYERTRLTGQEVLLSVMGTVGRPIIVRKEWAGWNVNRALAVIRLNKIIEKEFFYFWLQSPKTQAFFRDASIGSAQKRINLKDFRKVRLPLPPWDEQDKICSIIGEVFNKVNILHSKKTYYETLKKRPNGTTLDRKNARKTITLEAKRYHNVKSNAGVSPIRTACHPVVRETRIRLSQRRH